MSLELTNILYSAAGLVAGALIGAGFGVIQNRARRRNEERQQQGGLKSGWAVMPGSMSRVGYLLITLVIVQIFCPLLFVDGTQWWVSGGVVAGYGVMLFRELRRHRTRGPLALICL